MCNDFVGIFESILPITYFFTNVSLENHRHVQTICKLMIKELYAIFNKILNLFDGMSWDEFLSVSSVGVSSGDVFFWSCFCSTSYVSGLFHWHQGNLTIASVPMKQPRRITMSQMIWIYCDMAVLHPVKKFQWLIFQKDLCNRMVWCVFIVVYWMIQECVLTVSLRCLC